MEPKPLIPPVAGPPPTTPTDRLNALEHMAVDAASSTGIFYGIGSAFGIVVRPLNPSLAEKLASSLAALHLPDPPQAKPALPKPGRLALLYLAPAPFGVAPPEAYGLRPDYMARNPDTDTTGTFRYLARQLGALPGDDRLRYYQQQQADAYEALVRGGLPNASNAALLSDFATFSSAQFAADVPNARPAVLAGLVADELRRRGVALPGAANLPPLLPPTGPVGPGASAAAPPSPVPAPPADAPVGNRVIAPNKPAAVNEPPPGAAANRTWLEVVNERTREYLRSLSATWFKP